MDKIRIGDNLQIQCYKHNKRIHRCWDEAVVLDIKKDYQNDFIYLNAMKCPVKKIQNKIAKTDCKGKV